MFDEQCWMNLINNQTKKKENTKMPKFFNVRAKEKNVAPVFVTGSVANDFKKTREFYRSNVHTFINAFDIAKSEMKIESNEWKLFFRNIRSSLGYCKDSSKELAIDVRRYDVKQIVSTIIHELQHSKQYDEGLLEKSEKRNHKKWKGENVKTCSSTVNYEEYLKLPWEIDARNAEKKYLDKVMKRLEEK